MGCDWDEPGRVDGVPSCRASEAWETGLHLTAGEVFGGVRTKEKWISVHFPAIPQAASGGGTEGGARVATRRSGRSPKLMRAGRGV